MHIINAKKIYLYICCLIVVMLIAYIVLPVVVPYPDLEYLVVLGSIRDCIWHGFEGYEILYSQNKKAIVLPESLLELTPLPSRSINLKECKNALDNCKLIYNPNGYKDKTWIAIYVTKGIGRKFLGDYVLLYNKEIKRERNILKTAPVTNGLKYYTVSFY